MENSIPIPQGKPGMEWNGMEWNLEYSMVEPTSNIIAGSRRVLATAVDDLVGKLLCVSSGTSLRLRTTGVNLSRALAYSRLIHFLRERIEEFTCASRF